MLDRDDRSKRRWSNGEWHDYIEDQAEQCRDGSDESDGGGTVNHDHDLSQMMDRDYLVHLKLRQLERMIDDW